MFNLTQYMCLLRLALGCTPCPGNTYAVPDGLGCVGCPAGTHAFGAPAASPAECVACPPNKFSVAGQSCSSCLRNTAAFGGETVCWACPANKISFGAGDDCSDCAAGTSRPRPVDGDCALCPAGTYRTAEMLGCLSCPAGTDSPKGAASCTSCPANYYSDPPNVMDDMPTMSSRCIPCPGGKYSLAGTPRQCTLCPPNKYAQPGRGCVPCESGKSTECARGAERCSDCTASSAACACTGDHLYRIR